MIDLVGRLYGIANRPKVATGFKERFGTFSPCARLLHVRQEVL